MVHTITFNSIEYDYDLYSKPTLLCERVKNFLAKHKKIKILNVTYLKDTDYIQEVELIYDDGESGGKK